MNVKNALLITSDKSGSGKSLVSQFLCRYFLNSGKKVVPFKCGPDYIDTLHLKKASKTTAYNLDSVLLNKVSLKKLFYEKIRTSDIGIVEGVMGFFDGIHYKDFKGSSYHIAKVLNLPVLPVLDVSSSSFTVAARVSGIVELAENVNILGIILNKVASSRHEEMIRSAVEYHTGVKVIGSIPRLKDIEIGSRHLGLKTALEVDDDYYDKLTEKLKKFIDVDTLLEFSRYEIENVEIDDYVENAVNKKAYIAYDESFNFYYSCNLEFLQKQGYKLYFFSPLKGEVPKDPDFIYFGGGYPELFSEKLSANESLKRVIKEFSCDGVPIFAECGGMMFLSRGIYIENNFYEMCGIFDFTVEMTKRLQRLGYVFAWSLKDTFYFEKGDKFVGHEFHYSNFKEVNEDFVLKMSKFFQQGEWFDGFFKNRTFASYTHFHFLSENCILKNLIRG